MRSLVAVLFLAFSAAALADQSGFTKPLVSPYKFEFKDMVDAGGARFHTVTIFADNLVYQAPILINKNKFRQSDFIIDGHIDQIKLFAHPELRSRLENHVYFYKLRDPEGDFKISYPATGGAKLSVKSQNGQDILADFSQFTNKLSNSILATNFHISVNPETNVADVDYKFTIVSQTPYLIKFAFELTRPILNRSKINLLSYLLTFVQSIPYDTPLDNSFRTPLAVLDEKKGDCDEKGVLLAALLKITIPNIQPGLLVIQTKQGPHAITIVEWPYDHPNKVLIDDKPYLAMETTDIFPIGILPEEVSEALNSGHYYMIRL